MWPHKIVLVGPAIRVLSPLPSASWCRWTPALPLGWLPFMLRIKSRVLKTGPKAYYHQFVLSSSFLCQGLCTGSSLCPQSFPHTNITLLTEIDSSFVSWRNCHLSFASSPKTLGFSFGALIHLWLFISLALTVLSVPLRPRMGVFCASRYPHYLATPGTQ